MSSQLANPSRAPRSAVRVNVCGPIHTNDPYFADVDVTLTRGGGMARLRVPAHLAVRID